MKTLLIPRTDLWLENPVLTASGTFGYGTEYAARMDLSGLGAVICKGTTRQPRTGNQPTRLTETPAGMLNAIGLQNIGLESLIAEKAPIWAGWEVPVFVNLSGTSVEDYVHLVSHLEGVPGISGVELNISCPNVAEGGVQFGVDPGLAGEVTKAARAATSLPLIVKLSPNVSDIRAIAANVEAAGADTISLINTVYGMTIDPRRRSPVLDNISGGLSGPAIRPLALHLVYHVAQEVSIPVIGIGGITTAQDAIEFLLAGASAVQMGTALMLNPTSWRDVVLGVNRWCELEGVRNLQEIVGTANHGFKGIPLKRETGALTVAGS